MYIVYVYCTHCILFLKAHKDKVPPTYCIYRSSIKWGGGELIRYSRHITNGRTPHFIRRENRVYYYENARSDILRSLVAIQDNTSCKQILDTQSLPTLYR